jgi:hypothetical protein
LLRHKWRRQNARVLSLCATLALSLVADAALCATDANGAAAAGDNPDCSAWVEGDAQRPLHLPPRPDGPTPLRIGFEILDVTNVDVLHGQFNARVRVDFAWCDPRLAPAARETGSDFLYLTGAGVVEKMETTWNANLSMTNQIGALHVLKRQMQIGSDGRVRVSGILEGALAVNLDLRRFPFDAQVLTIEVEPFGWDNEAVVLEVDEERTRIVQHFQLAEWKLGAVQAQVVEVGRTGTDRRFSQLNIRVPIQRKSGFYIWKAILPLMLIVALSWSVFWITESAGGRIRICATVMLTIVAYQFATAADLPKLPYMTLFTAFTTLSFVTVGVTVVSIVVSFHRMEGGDATAVERNDQRSRWLIPLLYFLAVGALAATYLS